MRWHGDLDKTQSIGRGGLARASAAEVVFNERPIPNEQPAQQHVHGPKYDVVAAEPHVYPRHQGITLRA